MNRFEEKVYFECSQDNKCFINENYCKRHRA